MATHTIKFDGADIQSEAVTTTQLTMNTVPISVKFSLQNVTTTGNTTTEVVQFTNPTTGLVTTSNVIVGGGLEVGGDLGSTLLNTLYPVGMVLAMVQNWGGFTGQTWVQFAQGRTLVGQDSSDTAFDAVTPTAYIGEKAHTLTKAEIPPHHHNIQTYEDRPSHYVSYTSATSYPMGYDDTPLESTDNGNVGSTENGLNPAAAHNNVQPYEVVYYYKRTA